MLMLGLTTGSFDALRSTRTWCDRYGSHAAPDACWLALRGFRVIFPVLPDDRGHALWKEQFSGGAGPFTLELRTCKEPAFEQFIDGLTLFGIGTSWGGFESLVMPAIPHRLRSMAVQPDEGRLVRLHVGLEDPVDLCSDFAQALAFV